MQSRSPVCAPCGSRPGMKAIAPLWALLALTAGCTEDAKKDTPPPGPPPVRSTTGATPPATSDAAVAPSAHACGAEGGSNADGETSAVFPRTIGEGAGKFCIDPQGEVRTYGEAGKYNMDEVCTTAFDGECEVYKNFKLKRVVTISYIDDGGKGINAEVVLSRFATPDGAYGLFTKRVVADRDPKGDGVPKPLTAGAAGAIGTGRAYMVRGNYLAELQYNSDSESPSQLAASSQKILTALATAIGDKLKGDAALPLSAKTLPTAGLVPSGIQYYPETVPGFGAVGPAAFGFYDEGGARTRVLSIARANEGEAKAAFAKVKGKGKPVAGVGDEAVQLNVAAGDKEVEFILARKGARVLGVGDEEFAVKSGSKPLGAEALTERAKKLVSTP